ncbi:MAG: prolyl oligopeptidase family serine peptidase [Oscillospiraceae bacterium]|jgi:predicted esterase|nr:prolyl oligopeptidase family serine peptidase [Oscillospiraceae bacterium]
MKKRVFFAGVEALGGVAEVAAAAGSPAHRVYHAIIDGKAERVKVLPALDLVWNPGYAVWPGVYECDFTEDGYIASIAVDESLVTGYGVYAPTGGELVLGTERTTYKFVPDATVYTASKTALPENFVGKIEDLRTVWDDNFFLDLNGDGVIQTMYIVRAAGQSYDPILPNIQKFGAEWGAVDEESGLAMEYNYYLPPETEGARHPLFIWFHGLHSGTSTWTSLYEFNPIANWAAPEFQSLFTSGGAYIMVPRANEDLRTGHGISWNPLQVKPFLKALDGFLEKHPAIDRDAIYIGGFSMGGGMTWLVIRERPDLFAAAVPCCPRTDYIGDLSELHRVAKLPIWEIHGEEDTPREYTEQLRAVLIPNAQAVGTDTRLLVLPHGYLLPDGVTPMPVDHLVWLPTLNNLRFNDGTPYSDASGEQVQSTLIEWLNEQSKIRKQNK